MAQHERTRSSAAHVHLKEKIHSFEDENVHVLDREDRLFQRGVKEAIYLKLEQPSFNRGGGLRYQLSTRCNAVLKSLAIKLNHSTKLGSCEPATHMIRSHRVGAGFRTLFPLPSRKIFNKVKS